MNEPELHPHPPPSDHHDQQTKSFIPILILLAAIYLFYSLNYSYYTPEDPILSVTSVQIQDYFITGSAVSFIFTFHASVINPTRSAFSYSSSSAVLFYAGRQVGSMAIPGRRVTSGMQNDMKVSINVNPLPLTVVGYIPVMYGLKRGKPTMELELMMKLVGKTTVFWFFYHRHVEFAVHCRVSFVLSDGSLHNLYC